ncbi:MAG: hypothetical protein E7632_03170 [Ruminococcaceae bacterium]|nr:hypothetical protein [Oscillospiraceae bacterium]
MKTGKSRFTRTLSFALILGQLALLASCGGSDTPSGNSSDATASGATGDKSGYTDEMREYFDPIPAENLGGEFRVGVGAEGQFHIAEENGDIINDALYRRNLAVSTLYGVEMKEIVTKDDNVTSSVLAGDDAYDAYFVNLYRNAAKLATADMLTDVNSIDSLNLDAIWWDQNLLDTTTIAGKQFFLAGDIDYTLYGRTIALFFNKAKMKDMTDENIYQLVLDGKWTFDKFDSLQKNATQDLNGDAKMDDQDSYGVIYSAVHASVLYSASGGRIVENNNGNFTLVMDNNRNMDVITKIFDITLGASEYCYNTDKESQDGIWDRVLVMFRNKQALFQSTVLYNAIKQRSMEDDFGILPYPKYDEAQENYYATSYNGNKVFVIPKTVSETERVGKILNALCFEGRFTVKPAFYDEALGTKFIRDDESKEMLDIIFNNIIYDVGFMYNLNSLGDLIRNMHKKGNTNFASEYAKMKVAAQTELDDLIKMIDEME